MNSAGQPKSVLTWNRSACKAISREPARFKWQVRPEAAIWHETRQGARFLLVTHVRQLRDSYKLLLRSILSCKLTVPSNFENIQSCLTHVVTGGRAFYGVGQSKAAWLELVLSWKSELGLAAIFFCGQPHWFTGH